MSLFKKAEMSAAHLKMGILGFAGAGKSYTSSLVAIGLYKAALKKKVPYAGRPVFFLDTEGGSDYLVPTFEKAEVPFMVHRTRAFVELKEAMKEAEQEASVFIIDSISHFWIEWQEAYKQKKNRKRGLEFSDWGEVKREWRTAFTEPFLNSNLHIIMCGRASWEYDHFTDDAGKKQIEKSGIKMSAEKELGFEPSLLVYMEHDTDPVTKRVTRSATVMKDRFQILDGKSFENPTFKDFVPHIEKLAWGQKQGGVDVSRTSTDMVEPDTYDNRKIALDIVRDEIKNLMTKHFGTSQADKKTRIELLEAAFGTASETAIEKQISLEDLRTGYDRMHLQLEGTRSRYFAETEAEIVQTPVEEDGIPEFTLSPEQIKRAQEAHAEKSAEEKPRIRVKANGEVAQHVT